MTLFSYIQTSNGVLANDNFHSPWEQIVDETKEDSHDYTHNNNV